MRPNKSILFLTVSISFAVLSACSSIQLHQAEVDKKLITVVTDDYFSDDEWEQAARKYCSGQVSFVNKKWEFAGTGWGNKTHYVTITKGGKSEFATFNEQVPSAKYNYYRTYKCQGSVLLSEKNKKAE